MKSSLPFLFLLICSSVLAQTQSCPLNSNFSVGALTHWFGYTGNNLGGNGPLTIKAKYDSLNPPSTGTQGTTQGTVQIDEYQLPGTSGIKVIGASGTDPYGLFTTIPKINGYQYSNSVLLGSTAITRASNMGTQGGYVRGISYAINVPASPVNQPYTMTYAYAMVLENGTHNSDQQPLFSATLTVHDSTITCASPKYFLPTMDNADSRGSGAILDTALAKSQGFYLSNLPSPNANPNGGVNAGHLSDVWAKGWTEVTFDLSPWRGQQVKLTFEADNCVPGGHFAYAYVALRNTCDGLMISGPAVACRNSTLTYSIPGLTGATYSWQVPPDWQIVSGADSNILQVKIGTAAGKVEAHEINSCANLSDTIDVTTTAPTVAGAVVGDNEVCTGSNTSTLTLVGYTGSILNWLASADGVHYTAMADIANTYMAQDLTTTTLFKALVQNGGSCTIDTSSAGAVVVDPKSVGGQLTPANMDFCIGQNKDALLTLANSTGSVLNWQSSQDVTNWTDFNPADTNKEYQIIGINTSTEYRLVVQSGVCPADTSAISSINFLAVLYPQAAIDPTDTTICYGAIAGLSAAISVGTNYSWSNTTTLSNEGDGNITSIPYVINASASPLALTDYVLKIENAGCTNILLDTFRVHVIPPIIVDAGNDTSIVMNEPLKLHATSNDTSGSGDFFTWTPATGLDNAFIPSPVAILGADIDSVRYFVKATSEFGCYGVASIVVKVFKTGPDIFVPNAFTPGKGINTIFRPIPVGIASLQYFRVYNRWGQLVYSTSRIGDGWDGMLGGKMQETGSYVWLAQGISYTGKVVFRKGTMVLIR